MKIVIDIQGAQASSYNRGIGRYIKALTKAIILNGKQHQIHLAINGTLTESTELLREFFADLISTDAIHVYALPKCVNGVDPNNNTYRLATELMWEAFIANIEPDVILIGSLFEGSSDNVVSSIHSLHSRIPTAVILFDLIPLIHKAHYLQWPPIQSWYMNKLAHLQRADLLLAISESSRQEAINHLSFDPQSVINISAAADAHFKPITISQELEQTLQNRYQLTKPFVMYTGGIDYRKNIEGLIKAYAKIPASIRNLHQLAIVCSVSSDERMSIEKFIKQVGLSKSEIILTGFVSEQDLLLLYNLCTLFIFPSLHEGFGLPVLEAMHCGRAVIGANISSIPEVIGLNEALFDPYDEQAIADLIIKVLSDKVFKKSLEEHSLVQAKKFSWDNSAKTALTALEKLAKKSVHTRVAPVKRPKLAYISPLPPERSGISVYGEELLPYLACHYEIDLILNQEKLDPIIASVYQHHDIAWFKKNAYHYDRVLYHFGNSDYHEHMFDLLQEIPGIVVLHDFFLSGIMAHMEAALNKPATWTRSLYISHGYHAVQQRFHVKDTADIIFKYPCNLEILQSAQSIITHSEYARKLGVSFYGHLSEKSWNIIPLLCVPPTKISKNDARNILKLPQDSFIVCSFGYLAATKLNHHLVKAWEISKLAGKKQCLLIFVGERNDAYGCALLENSTATNIQVTGWTNADTFQQYMAAADVAVQLRNNSRGETSKAVLDCMNYGIATIVNNHGSFKEIPEDDVWKIPDQFECADLVKALESLWNDRERCHQLGQRGQDLVRKHHNPRACAKQYFDVIEESYEQASGNLDALVKSFKESTRISESNEQDLTMLAHYIAQGLPARIRVPQLLIDISILVNSEYTTKLHASYKESLDILLKQETIAYRVEPIYLDNDNYYRYARKFTLNHLDCPEILFDEIIEYYPSDVFLNLTPQSKLNKQQQIFHRQLRNHGIPIYQLSAPSVYQQFLTLLNTHPERLLVDLGIIKTNVTCTVEEVDEKAEKILL